MVSNPETPELPHRFVLRDVCEHGPVRFDDDAYLRAVLHELEGMGMVEFTSPLEVRATPHGREWLGKWSRCEL